MKDIKHFQRKRPCDDLFQWFIIYHYILRYVSVVFDLSASLNEATPLLPILFPVDLIWMKNTVSIWFMLLFVPTKQINTCECFVFRQCISQFCYPSFNVIDCCLWKTQLFYIIFFFVAILPNIPNGAQWVLCCTSAIGLWIVNHSFQLHSLCSVRQCLLIVWSSFVCPSSFDAYETNQVEWGLCLSSVIHPVSLHHLVLYRYLQFKFKERPTELKTMKKKLFHPSLFTHQIEHCECSVFLQRFTDGFCSFRSNLVFYELHINRQKLAW